MATLEKIRNRAGLLVAIVIGFALFAFILGDILGSGTSLFTNTQFEIAEIGGTSIPYQDFQRRIDNLTEIYKMNTGTSALPAEVYESLFEQAWLQLVSEEIMTREYERLGLVVGSDEFFDMVQGNNVHPIIQQIFTDPSTGIYNQEAMFNFLRNMSDDPTGASRNYWLFVEKEIVTERKADKYNNLLQKGLYVNDVQAKNAFMEANKRVDFDFVVSRYAFMSDTLVHVIDKEIRDYYRKNKPNFLQEESRDIEYVIFDILPSREDEQEASEWIQNLIDEFSSTSEVRQFTNLNSDTPYDETNYSFGELSPEINEFMFNARTGDIYGPYFEDGSFKLARLNEINFLPDSVRARHILIQPSQEITADQARAKADSLLNLVRRGANFEMLAIEHSADNGSRFSGGDLNWFREGMMVKPFNDASFSARRGDKFLVETQFGFHVVELTDRSPERKKVQVAILERRVEPGTATYQRIFSQASMFAGQNSTFEKFQETASAEGLPKRVATVLPADNRIPGLDSPRELIRWAFNSKEKSVSPVFELGERFVVVTLSKVREKGNKPLDEVRDEIEIILRKDKKADKIKADITKELASGLGLEELAEKMNTVVESASGITFSSFSVPNAGIEPKVIAWATTLEEGTISEPIAGESGVFILKIRNIELPEETDVTPDKSRLQNNYMSRVGFEAFEALKKLANIKDNRSKFF